MNIHFTAALLLYLFLYQVLIDFQQNNQHKEKTKEGALALYTIAVTATC